MKKLLLAISLVLLALTSCTDKNDLKGTLPNNDNDGKKVYLLGSEDSFGNFEVVDSAVVEGNEFSFERTISAKPVFFMVNIPDIVGSLPQRAVFVNEKGTVTMTIDTVVSVKGTPLNDVLQETQDKGIAIENKLKALDGELRTISDTLARKAKQEQAKILIDEYNVLLVDCIKKNAANCVGEFFFLNTISPLDPKFDELLPLMDKTFQDKVKVMLANETQTDNTLPVGASYIDLKGQTPDGKTIALSDYVGKNKLVLIDFWASWCGPCVKEMPSVVDVYAKYKGKGLEIVGISLDEKKEDWTAALSKLNMTWPQMSDLKGWNSMLSIPYGVESIPHTLLIGKDGKVVAKNLRGEELQNKIDELLK
ncbi:thiol-disulfide isomerase/thioredoxin [Dysgonomonas sp. PH5-45]|uniref:TlpA disulfide reductase family protein n=1 Tax=unclassified Dysgonomonas TaxID=2630389 RepID=UPI002476EC16|nr:MULTISPECIES: TlpA disulfide reductase family protein [unclassified Dysgonomonas]MDH6356062.1 thiol-disulfide isomerase/thioredoxin [Dysgonomonas sp. PH5-45]MDH6388956.1 thiol-disulfide isomerase/thioredoxin [Dysgonomonas sp. PH5-37]